MILLFSQNLVQLFALCFWGLNDANIGKICCRDVHHTRAVLAKAEFFHSHNNKTQEKIYKVIKFLQLLMVFNNTVELEFENE